MAKGKKYYSVAVGRKPGIYESWSEAEAQVKGFGGAKFKGFPTRKEARDWLENPVYKTRVNNRRKRKAATVHVDDIENGTIHIYTDGGAINNPGPGGYGVVILDGESQREMSGGFKLTTNNRMELTACIVGLEHLGQEHRPITLFSDSSYVVNAINKGWVNKWRQNNWKKADGNRAVNQDLWVRLLNCIEDLDITFKWVKGHSGHPLNELCDQLAVAAAKGSNLLVDKGYLTQGLMR